MGLLLAALTAFCIGSGEVFGSRAAQRARPIEVTTAYFLAGLALFALLWPFVDEQFNQTMMTFGALAGIVNAIALVALHYAYRATTVGVALPIVAVVSLIVPVAVDMAVNGVSPSGMAAVGIGLGIMAVALTSYQGDGGRWLSRGAALAVFAGVTFGFVYPLLGAVDPGEGLLPLVLQRGAGLVVVALMALATGPRIVPGRGDRALPGVSAAFSAAAVLLFTVAVQRATLTEVSVVANQFPAVAVFGSWLLNGERVRWWQWLGLAGACGAVALIAVG